MATVSICYACLIRRQHTVCVRRGIRQWRMRARGMRGPGADMRRISMETQTQQKFRLEMGPNGQKTDTTGLFTSLRWTF